MELKLEYERNKPVLKMKVDNVKMTFSFAEKESEVNIKQNIIDILTSQYTEKVTV